MPNMSREYEALSKLIGRNFAVLDDGTSVHLTPDGEIRDVNDKLIMGADEGRARLYEKNMSGGGTPGISAADEGKFLRVVEGKPAWSAVPNAEGASF